MSLRMLRALRVHGERVTLNTRTVGSRDANTGQAAITYGTSETIRAFVGRPTSRPTQTELGNVTETTRPLITGSAISKLDKITLEDGVYYVRDTPTQVNRGIGNDERLVYQTTIVRDPLG